MEVLTLAKMKISKALDLPESMVRATVDLKDGKVTPSFGIGSVEGGELFNDEESQNKVRETIAGVWGGLLPELDYRMRELELRRHGYRD